MKKTYEMKIYQKMSLQETLRVAALDKIAVFYTVKREWPFTRLRL